MIGAAPIFFSIKITDSLLGALLNPGITDGLPETTLKCCVPYTSLPLSDYLTFGVTYDDQVYKRVLTHYAALLRRFRSMYNPSP